MIVGSVILLFIAGVITPIISVRNTEGILDEVTDAITYCDV